MATINTVNSPLAVFALFFYISHRRSPQIKQAQTDILDLESGAALQAVRHYKWCGVASGEWVPQALLGWYFLLVPLFPNPKL